MIELPIKITYVKPEEPLFLTKELLNKTYVDKSDSNKNLPMHNLTEQQQNKVIELYNDALKAQAASKKFEVYVGMIDLIYVSFVIKKVTDLFVLAASKNITLTSAALNSLIDLGLFGIGIKLFELIPAFYNFDKKYNIEMILNTALDFMPDCVNTDTKECPKIR